MAKNKNSRKRRKNGNGKNGKYVPFHKSADAFSKLAG